MVKFKNSILVKVVIYKVKCVFFLALQYVMSKFLSVSCHYSLALNSQTLSSAYLFFSPINSYSSSLLWDHHHVDSPCVENIWNAVFEFEAVLFASVCPLHISHVNGDNIKFKLSGTGNVYMYCVWSLNYLKRKLDLEEYESFSSPNVFS